MTVESKTKADAYPTKAFFVRMITRDISLEDCILDLIDNCVDGALRQVGSPPIKLNDGPNLSNYIIEIKTSPDQFTIRDNCGGMSLDDAVEHAFSFGRPSSVEHEDFSIGVYGIGMKRAVFKLGNIIKIRSTFAQDDGSPLSFAVPINVQEWLQKETQSWDFDIVSDEPLDQNGVQIEVNQLTPGASILFESPAFIENLRRIIARDYSIHLQLGLKIFLNDQLVQGWSIQLRQSDQFVPMRETYTDTLGEDEVLIEIIGGMAAPPPDSNDPEDDEGDRRHGWYVVCNGRVVVAADKSSLTGWGTDGWPQWHSQYTGFIGIILFTAANAAALPLTTTKRSIDTSSEVFRRSRHRMRELSKAWIAYTNLRKQALDEAKDRERKATPVHLSAVARHATARFPSLTPKHVEKPANVNYSVPVRRMRSIAQALGDINKPYREVGIETFEYAYRDLVGSDE